jgi:hypothetical protein
LKKIAFRLPISTPEHVAKSIGTSIRTNDHYESRESREKRSHR